MKTINYKKHIKQISIGVLFYFFGYLFSDIFTFIGCGLICVGSFKLKDESDDFVTAGITSIISCVLAIGYLVYANIDTAAFNVNTLAISLVSDGANQLEIIQGLETITQNVYIKTYICTFVILVGGLFRAFSIICLAKAFIAFNNTHLNSLTQDSIIMYKKSRICNILYPISYSLFNISAKIVYDIINKTVAQNITTEVAASAAANEIISVSIVRILFGIINTVILVWAVIFLFKFRKFTKNVYDTYESQEENKLIEDKAE